MLTASRAKGRIIVPPSDGDNLATLTRSNDISDGMVRPVRS